MDELEAMKRDIRLAKKVQATLKRKSAKDYLTNPNHGGKVTCHSCNGFIIEGNEVGYHDHQHSTDFPAYHFHKECFNRYEHYYGIDKPLD